MTFHPMHPMHLTHASGPHAEALARELYAAGHLNAPEWPAMADAAPESRWIAALQIGGGWLAAVFLLLFLGFGALWSIRDASGWIAVGLLLSAGVAAPMMRTQSAALRQFLFALSMAGHGALVVGIFMFNKHGDTGWAVAALAVALYEAVLLVWVAWPPHRLVAALLCCGALALALYLTMPGGWRTAKSGWWFGFYWLAACLLWLREPRWLSIRHAEAIMALAAALGLLSLIYALFLRSAHEFFGTFHSSASASGSFGFSLSLLMLAAVNAVFIVLLARGLPRDMRHLGALALLLVALALTWKAPAVGMGAVALTLGFARGRAWLMWIGGAALVYGVGRFYYDLNLSLLHKSGLMALGGGLLLAVWALLGRENGERTQ
jgi:hypothetical protein